MLQKKLRILLFFTIYSVLLMAISSCTFNSENQRQKMIAEITDSLNKKKQTEMKHEEEKRTHEEEIKRREEEKLKENCINMYSQLKNGLEQYTDVSSYKIKAFQVFEDKIVDRERGTIYFHAIDKITIFYNVYGNSIFLCARGENQNEIQLCLPIDDRNVKQECRLAHILCGYLKCKFNIIKTVNFEYKSDYTNQKHAEDVVRAIRKEYDQL